MIHSLTLSIETPEAVIIAEAMQIEGASDQETVEIAAIGKSLTIRLGSRSLSRLRALCNGYLGLLGASLELSRI